MNSPTLSPYTSLCLKFVGAILVLSSLVDYIVLAVSTKFVDENPAGLIGFFESLTDRGIVPMVGMCFLLIAYWMSSSDGSSTTAKLDMRLPACILACILCLIFLFSVPVYLVSLSKASTTLLTQIETGANEAETRIKSQFDQLTTLSKNPKQLENIDTQLTQLTQAISTGTYQGKKLSTQEIQQLQGTKTQLQGFRELAKDDKALKKRLAELQNQLKSQKQERENTAKTEIVKKGIRTGLSSLMLAIGYAIIGWFGIKSIGSSGSPSIRKPSAR